MEAPCPCDRCGEFVELDSMRFRTSFCDCNKYNHYGGCSHGICKACFAELEEESED